MDRRIDFRDIKGFYTDEGKGETVVLIHGFCEDGSVWDYFREKLSADFRLIVPDLPGFRNSAFTKQELTIDWMADFVRAILDKEKIQNPIIIGHSMGGYIALALAERYPDLPAGIGLFHSHCFADDDEKKQNRQKGIDFVSKNGTAEFVSELYSNLFGEKFLSESKSTVEGLKAHAKIYPAETIMNCLKAMMNRPERVGVLKSFRKPVLFILGKRDKVISYEKSLEQCALPEVSEVHILENAGHMGMLEEPEKTLEVVAEFANLRVKPVKG